MKMGVFGEIEKNLGIPRAGLAALAIIFGILILVFPSIFHILVALFLIVWGILELVKTSSTPSKSSSGTS